jgi:hypothetical protein
VQKNIKDNKPRNKQFQTDTHFTFHFTVVHNLDMFRALLAHPQEALHKRRVGDRCVRVVDLGWSQDVGRKTIKQ